MKFEEKDLESALTKAAKELACSVVDLDYVVLQHPSKGFLGLFKKNAIIEVQNKKIATQKADKTHKKNQTQNFHQKKADEKANSNHFEKRTKRDDTLHQKKEALPKEESISKERLKTPEYRVKTDEIFQDFYKEGRGEKKAGDFVDEIRVQLDALLKTSGFKIAIAELSAYNDECIFIKLDGEDAALLIGKEGYRYKALSYLLHNWINSKYNLLVRLEIAEFLKNQEQGVELYLRSIIERIEITGKAQTKPLDGVLVKIALEKLRARFPNKYVSIRQNGDDQRFVVVSDFFKKDE